MSNLLEHIPAEWLEQMKSQAEREYPKECCGVILGPARGSPFFTQWVPCRNAADEFHRRDPAQFPRSAEQAYWMDPHELLNLHRTLRESGNVLKLIYHSHINSSSQFSEEDTRLALFEGEPVYPGTLYAVFSVQQGKVFDLSLYGWDASAFRYQLQERKLFDP